MVQRPVRRLSIIQAHPVGLLDKFLPETLSFGGAQNELDAVSVLIRPSMLYFDFMLML